MKTRVSLKYFMIVFGNNFLILIRYQTPSKLILVTAFPICLVTSKFCIIRVSRLLGSFLGSFLEELFRKLLQKEKVNSSLNMTVLTTGALNKEIRNEIIF